VERYQRLTSIGEKLYQNGAPILIEAGVLLMDTQSNSVLAQMKFLNLSSEVIKALQISLIAYDVGGSVLKGVDEFQYLDLNVKQGEFFGTQTPVYFPMQNTRSYEIKDITVFFTDGQKWNSSEKWNSITAPRKITYTGEMKKQYQNEFGYNAEYLYDEQLDFWICACGTINKNDKCYLCECKKAHLQNFAEDELKNKLEIRLENERIESQKKAEREKERIQKEQEEKETERKLIEEQTRKRKKKTAIFAPVVLVALVLAFVLLQPFIQKSKVSSLIVKKEYSQAIELAKEIGDESYITEVKREIIRSYVYDNKYTQAMKIVQEIEDDDLEVEIVLKYAKYLEKTDLEKSAEQYRNIQSVSSEAQKRLDELLRYINNVGEYECVEVISHNYKSDIKPGGLVSIFVKAAMLDDEPRYTINWMDTDLECGPGGKKTKEVKNSDDAYIDIEWSTEGYIKATYRYTVTVEGKDREYVMVLRYEKQKQ